MARVQRGNVVLRVREDEVQRYLKLGYDLTDSSGTILQAAMPNDLATLQRAYVNHTAKIAELENTIAKLTAELAEAKASKTSTTTSVEPTPKTTSKKSTKNKTAES